MADLAEALDAALTDRYHPTGVKSPLDSRRGFTARINQLEKAHAREGDRPGAARRRAAQAAGFSPDTWTRWIGGQRPPSAASLRKLETAYVREITLPNFRKTLRTKGVPHTVRVTATIRWSKSPPKQYNAQPHRSTTLTGMRQAMVSTIRAWVAGGPEAAAQAFEEGAAKAYKSDVIAFEGDDVTIEFP